MRTPKKHISPNLNLDSRKLLDQGKIVLNNNCSGGKCVKRKETPKINYKTTEKLESKFNLNYNM